MKVVGDEAKNNMKNRRKEEQKEGRTEGWCSKNDFSKKYQCNRTNAVKKQYSKTELSEKYQYNLERVE